MAFKLESEMASEWPHGPVQGLNLSVQLGYCSITFGTRAETLALVSFTLHAGGPLTVSPIVQESESVGMRVRSKPGQAVFPQVISV